MKHGETVDFDFGSGWERCIVLVPLGSSVVPEVLAVFRRLSDGARLVLSMNGSVTTC